MNQILQTKIKNSNNNGKKKSFLKIQFYISIFVFLSLIVYLFFYWQNLHRDELYSDSLLSNYNLTRLYANSESSNSLYSSDFFSILNANSNDNPILGIIEIKAINVYYPFFAYYSDENLKLSPCKFFGPEPGKVGNICILGHNYNNDKFFSNVSLLKPNDEIVLYDNLQNSFYYFVENVYEVNNSDFSPIYDYDKNGMFLTLITCNNVNNNRIIVRACVK
ncbi:MAG: sortase [Clostridia bacterium]